MLARFALLASLALVPWTGLSSAADSRLATIDDEEPQASECGSAKQQGPSLDDPNVDTDPERPIVEHASLSNEESGGGDEEDGGQSDDFADGMCRSETLELWFQPEPNPFVHALAETGRALS